MGLGEQCSFASPFLCTFSTHPPPQSLTTPYLPEEQAVPILRGEGEDLTVKIKVFLLTADAEVIENKVGHIHPEETVGCQGCGNITRA